jgi:hypothetical protein
LKYFLVVDKIGVGNMIKLEVNRQEIILGEIRSQGAYDITERLIAASVAGSNAEYHVLKVSAYLDQWVYSDLEYHIEIQAAEGTGTWIGSRAKIQNIHNLALRQVAFYNSTHFLPFNEFSHPEPVEYFLRIISVDNDILAYVNAVKLFDPAIHTEMGNPVNRDILISDDKYTRGEENSLRIEMANGNHPDGENPVQFKYALVAKNKHNQEKEMDSFEILKTYAKENTQVAIVNHKVRFL